MSNRGSQQLECFCGNGADLQRFDILFGPSCECQNLFDEISGSHAGPMDFHQVFFDLRSGCRRIQRQFRIPDHCRQNVVEVVSDAAGQGADGFHFLGLLELGFHFICSETSLAIA